MNIKHSKSILDNILGPLELEVMKIIWKQQKVTVQTVVDELNKNKEYAYTTIMTIMSRLEKKKILRRSKIGKGYHYEPAYSPEELIKQISQQQIQGLLDEYGDIAIAQFVDTISNTPAKLDKLKQLITQLEQDEKNEK